MTVQSLPPQQRPGVGVNPLTGKPLEAWQVLVMGPPETGPRQTVVDVRPGAVLPRWILPLPLPAGGTVYLDTGRPGGTYGGPQVLPEVVVRGEFVGPLVAVVVLLVLGWLTGSGSRARMA